MFASLSLPLLVLVFAGAAVAVWFAGIKLSETTDLLADRFGLGEALGGLILLALATNLPEIAITASASLAGNPEIAVGNIFGGIAIQTVVMVLLDARGQHLPPLTSRLRSPVAVLEGLLVITVLLVAIMASQLPPSLTRIDSGAIMIALLWAGGLWLLNRARAGLPWRLTDDSDVGAAADDGANESADEKSEQRGRSSLRVGIVFAIAAAATLAGGVLLERSGGLIADGIGMSGVLFASTVLAAATALPEVSTGIAAIDLGDHELAVSDILGGNAFLPVLLLEANLITGSAVLPRAQASDIYLAGLGALLTAVYLTGFVTRPHRQIWRIGLDSAAVIVFYLLGIAGLVAIVST